MTAVLNRAAGALFVLLAGCAVNEDSRDGQSAAADAPPDGFSFMVIGDTPNGPEDEAMLAKALPLIKDGDYPFVIHIGDYKSGGSACTDDLDDRFASLLDALAPTPVFYTPGDNEWTDCDRNINEATGVLYSELDRLEHIRGLFFANPPTAFDARRLPEQPENATWSHEGVRFGTLLATGTNNGRMWVTGDPLERAAKAADDRDRNNLNWIALVFAAAERENAKAVVLAFQADMTNVRRAAKNVPCDGAAPDDKTLCDAFMDLRAAIAEGAESFGGPVLVIHGDTAPFAIARSFAGDETPNFWRLNAAGDAGVNRLGVPYGFRDVTRVTVTPSADEPFAAMGLTTGQAPAQK